MLNIRYFKILFLTILAYFVILCSIPVAGSDDIHINVDDTGFTELDYVTYYGYTGKTIKLRWNPSTGVVEHYQLQAFLVEQDRCILDVTLDANTTSYTYTTPKGGHYIFRVRAGNSMGYSVWSSSIDPTYSTVNGKPRAWWVYTHVAPSSGIIIE